MLKIILATSSIFFMLNASAAESRESIEPAPQKLDSMQACYYRGIASSKGAVEKMGDREFECMRTTSSNGFRTEGMPLEWVPVSGD